jgi:hypothetical protein
MKLRAAILGASVVAMTLSGVARAEEVVVTTAEKPYPSKEESIGMLGGAGIGALAGGPFGLVIGLALGGWVGDRMDTQKKTAIELEDRLAAAKKESEKLSAKLAAADMEVEALALQLKSSREKLALVDEKS